MPSQKLIVAVCRGNIMRSPIAEVCIRKEIIDRGLSEKIAVTSRGVQGTHVDPKPVRFSNVTFYTDLYAAAKPTLDQHHIDLTSHVSQRITEDIAQQAAVILAMDTKTLNHLHTLFPRYKYKMYLFSALVHDKKDVADPENLIGSDKQKYIIESIVSIVRRGFPELLGLIKKHRSINTHI